ncbi:phosphoserine phosphatase SerB [Desulfovibrio sp. X2]|uniref:phosphoserine phosphatase SerB n=1 Tax=Desulfovibrio sp. X2 TaxID=941449 RepID=UPI000358ABAA|nr:phosphoserine phosphatase SerB [Desulfovibrio sp. X2]EPR44088.1 phosphoserine phosphatase SerB [Desulfovibrio sp. X2]
MNEILLFQFTGEDRPGLVAAITARMARYNLDILDMGQAVIHDLLSLGILVHIPEQAESAPVVKDLLFLAHELDLRLRCIPVSEEEYGRWAALEDQKRYIVTLIGRTIGSVQVSELTQTLNEHGLNIEVITRLSGRAPLVPNGESRPACVEFFVQGTPDDALALRKEFLRIAQTRGVDIALQEDNVFRRNRRLVAFDMDSTLIQAEVIDELAKEAGVGEKVAAITESAMRGEIDFQESFRRRLRLLKGLSAEALERVAARIPMTEGAERLITNLKRFGYKIAIISGGFTWFGRKLQQRLGIDYLYANELEVKDGTVTGEVVGRIVDGARKAEVLREIAEREEISLQQVIAVGDGANDLPMLNIAGLGIAFHAKPVVKEGARQSISTLGLDSILFLVGLRERDTTA